MGPKVAAGKGTSITPEEVDPRWREQLQFKAKRWAESYAAAAEYLKKKAAEDLRPQSTEIRSLNT